MSDGLHDQDELDAFEAEGVQAFNRMTDAMHGLNNRMTSLDAGLTAKVVEAQQAAARAENAAEGVRTAAKHLEATQGHKARQAASWAVLGALAGILAAGAGAYWLGHASGREGGLADGYKTAVDEKAAAAWANTPTGKLALAMDQAGEMHALAACSRQGWTVETQQRRRICVVRPDAKGSIYGWMLP